MSTTLIVAAAILVWSVLGIGVCLFLAGARRADVRDDPAGDATVGDQDVRRTASCQPEDQR